MTKQVAVNVRAERLHSLEAIIQVNLRGFLEVGKALLEVRDDKLYRESHATFEAWCGERFRIGRRRAYELIAAVQVQDSLVRHGAQTLPMNERQARRLATLEEDDRADVWDHALVLAGDEPLGEKHVARAVREHNRVIQVQRLAEISKGNRPLKGVGKFPVILSDPPWMYDEGTADPTRVIGNQYPPMPLQDICDLDVGKVAATDEAVLFLWATVPLLPEAFEVMKAWGFEYRSGACWDKVLTGMGYWFRGQHELLLVGVRGNPPKPAPGSRSTSMLREQRSSTHSKKPDVVYRLIETYYPELPKLEMFCRDPRDGWTAWGTEA